MKNRFQCHTGAIFNGTVVVVFALEWDKQRFKETSSIAEVILFTSAFYVKQRKNIYFLAC
jgi:hypothetical protein